MTKKIISIFKSTALAFTVTCAVSCMEERVIPASEEVANDRLIVKFKVGGASDLSTKSDATYTNTIKQVAKYPLSDPRDETQLYLVCTEQSLDDMYFGDNAIGTKGTPVYTENFLSVYEKFAGKPEFQFDMTKKADGSIASKGSVETCGIGTGIFTCTDEANRTYCYDFGDGSKWPESVKSKNLIFYLSAPTTLAGCKNVSYDTVEDDNRGYVGTISFEYVTPLDATNQSDILFTTKTIDYDAYIANNHDGSKVLFYHALAGVKFKSNNAEYEAQDGCRARTTIKSITVTNVLTEGSCTVTPSYDPDYDLNDSNASGKVDKSYVCADWGEDSTKSEAKDFTLDMTEEGMGIVSNTEGQFPDCFDGANKYGKYNFNDADYKHTFFFIPQKTTNDVYLNIEYSIELMTATGTVMNKKDYSKSVSFKDQDWKAGYLYTYTLSANIVTVDVDDQIVDNGTTKTGLTIKNTGNTEAYIRCAVVANWYDGREGNKGDITNYQISSPCLDFTSTDVATMQYDLNIDSIDPSYPWHQGTSDGFYYYKKVVKPGESIPAEDMLILGKYTVKNSSGDAHLEINIAAQAIDASRVAKVTGWDTSWMSTNNNAQ